MPPILSQPHTVRQQCVPCSVRHVSVPAPTVDPMPDRSPTTPPHVNERLSVQEQAFRAVWAPHKIACDMDAFIDWAENHLGFMLTCGVSVAANKPAHSTVRHWVQVDPHTGETTAAPTEREREQADALHFLWAMSTGEALPCSRADAALATWVGPVHPGWIAPWPTRGGTHETMKAVRTVLRAVEYHDAGFDISRESEWLRAGVHPTTLTWLRERLAHHDISIAEANLRSHVLHATGTNHDLKPGRKAVSDTAWLSAVIEEWIRRRAHHPR